MSGSPEAPKSDRKLLTYCDESSGKGRFFSHFYGGALINARHRQAIEARLQKVKDENNLGAELKWTKISASYQGKYIAFLKEVFDIVELGGIKFRIMFTQNSNVPTNLDEHKLANQYFLLYYQLVKHAFGLMHCGEPPLATRVSIYLDDVPDNREKFDQFRRYVASLSMFPHFSEQRVYIPTNEITDVDSKDHVILQALDIVLGSMQFRLNDLHKEIPPGKRRRAKRTVAKENVYKYINSRIRYLYPNFNIGVSTGIAGEVANRWHHPYRHWLFIPSEHEVKTGVGKARNKKAP